MSTIRKNMEYDNETRKETTDDGEKLLTSKDGINGLQNGVKKSDIGLGTAIVREQKFL
jgi:hypothetical protein